MFAPETVRGRGASGAARSLQFLAAIGDAVEKLPDLLVHEFYVSGFGGRRSKMTLQGWDQNVLGARNLLGGLCGFLGRIVEILWGVHEQRRGLDALERLGGVAIESRRRPHVVPVIGPCLPNPVVGVEAAL